MIAQLVAKHEKEVDVRGKTGFTNNSRIFVITTKEKSKT